MLEKQQKTTNDFLKPEVVKASSTKVFKCTATLSPEIVETKFGDKLRISGEMDGVEYTWSPNNTTKDSLIDEWGADETKWIGKDTILGTMRVPTGDGLKLAIYTKKHLDLGTD